MSPAHRPKIWRSLSQKTDEILWFISPNLVFSSLQAYACRRNRREWIKLYHMYGSKPNLKKVAQKLGVRSLKNVEPWSCLFSGDSTTIHTDANTFERKRTTEKWKKRLENCKGSSTLRQNLVNVGIKMTEIPSFLFTHCQVALVRPKCKYLQNKTWCR